MNKLILLLLFIFIITGLKAQTYPRLNSQSFEWLFGIGKVGIAENDNIIYSLNNSPEYESEYIASKGGEVNSRFSSNWTFNKKHEFLLGVDLSIWSRKSLVTNGDVISGWRESTFPNSTISGQVDLLAGYRYHLLLKNNINLFIENFVHRKLYSGKYPGVNFSIEPGIGSRLKISENYSFVTVISFKQPIGNSPFIKVYQNNLGFRFGINKGF